MMASTTPDRFLHGPGWLAQLIAALTISVLGLVALPTTASACTCVQMPTNCNRLATADAVFLATVTRTELADPDLRRASPLVPADATVSGIMPRDELMVSLADVEPVRGASDERVFTASDSASCGYDFEVGRRYLIVASRHADGRLVVSLCSLTRPVERAAGLLAFASAVSVSSPDRMLFGHVFPGLTRTSNTSDRSPVEGARVRLTGSDTSSTEVDASGAYFLSGLQPGRYELHVDWPSSARHLRPQPPVPFEISPEPVPQCAEIDVIGSTDSAITGLVVTTEGHPVPDVFVRFRRANDLSSEAFSGGTETDATGVYALTGFPAGHYLVGLQFSGTPAPGRVATELFVPVDPTPHVVELPSGGRETLPPIVVRRLSVVEVTVIARDARGEPVIDATVSASMVESADPSRSASRGRTDTNGRVVLRLWRGEIYRVTVARLSGEVVTRAGDEDILVTIRR